MFTKPLFSSLMEIFLFFILKFSLEFSMISFQNQEILNLILYNLVIFIIFFSFLWLNYSDKHFLIVENYQYSLFTLLKFLMIIIDSTTMDMTGKDDSLSFLQGSYFLYLQKDLFNRRVHPFLNFLIFSLILVFLLIFWLRNNNLKFCIRVLILLFFLGCYFFSIKCQNIRKKKEDFFNVLNGFGVGVLAFEKKSKKIMFRNKFFENLIGTQISLNEDFRKYAMNFMEFTIYNVKKSYKYLLKLKGKPAKSNELFQKNLAVFLEKNMNGEAKKEDKIRFFSDESDESSKNGVFSKILKEIEALPMRTEENQELLSEKLKKVKENPTKYQIEIGNKDFNIKKTRRKNNVTLMSTNATTKTIKSLNFLKKTMIFSGKLQKKCSFYLKSLFRILIDKTDDINNPIPSMICQDKGPFTIISSFYVSKNTESIDRFFKLTIYHSKIDDIIFLTIKQHQETEIHDVLLEMQNIIGAMVSSISHELRTPLNCSLNLLEDLANNIDEMTFENYLKPILLSTKNLKFVINDLIDYSSLVSEKFKIHNTNFHLKNTILETMDIVSLGIEQKGIKFILDFEETLPEKIKSDPNRLNQILLNLLGNSLKYTQKGEISIKVIQLLKDSPNLDIIKISVSDTGAGMTKESMKSLGRLTFETKLAGFGLTTSNYIAEYLAPKPLSGLYVESKKGFGSTFSFYVENIYSDSLQGEELDICYLGKKLNKIQMTILDSKLSKLSLDEEKYEDDEILSPDLIETNPKMLSDQFNDEYVKDLDFKNKFFIYGSSKTDRPSKLLDSATLPNENNSPKYLQFSNRSNRKDSNYSIILKKVDEIDEVFTHNKFEENSNQFATKTSSFGSKLPSTLKSYTSQESKSFQSEKKVLIIEKFKKILKRKSCNCPDILLVDDYPFNLLVLEKMLEGFTLKIDTASSGDQAIQKIKTFYENSPCPKELKCMFYKCVLMDIDMPIKDGLETSKEISEYFKEKNFHQLIIPCTAFSDEETAKKCKEVGMVDYLEKPVSLETLEHVLYKNIINLCE